MAKAHFFLLSFFLYFSLFVHAALRVKTLAMMPILEVKECKLEFGQFWSRFERRVPIFSPCWLAVLEARVALSTPVVKG